MSSRRRNRIKSLRLNRLRMSGSPSSSDDKDSESIVSSTTDAEPRKVKPLIIKRTWTKIEAPIAGSPPALVLRSIPGGNQGSRNYNVELAKLLLRLNTSASTKGGDEPSERTVSSSSKTDDDSQTDEMSDVDVDENFLAVSNDEDSEMTESEAVDDKVQSPCPQPQVGICEVCQNQLTVKNSLGAGIPKSVANTKNVPGSASVQLFRCKICSVEFSSQGNLIIHLKVQNEKFPHICSYDPCQQSFRSIGQLLTHERMHAYSQRSPIRSDQNNLRVSPSFGTGGRIALRIFKAGRGTGTGAESPVSNRWNICDLRTQPSTRDLNSPNGPAGVSHNH